MEHLTSDPSLNLFAPASTEVSVINTVQLETGPTSTVNGRDPLHFHIDADTTLFTCPEIVLKLRVRVTDAKGTAIPSVKTLCLVPNAFSCMIDDVVVRANGVALNSNSGHYPYQAFVDNVYLRSPEELLELDGTELVYRDPTKWFAVNTEENPSYKARYKAIAGGVECSLEGRLKHPLFEQPRKLLPGIDLDIAVAQTTDAFRLITDAADFKVTITDARIAYTRAVVHDLHTMHIIKQLQLQPATYSVLRKRVRTFQIPTGGSFIEARVETSSHLPSFAAVIPVWSSTVQGSPLTNPDDTQLRLISSLSMKCEAQTLPSQPYNLTTQADQRRAFADMKRVCKRICGRTNGVDFEEFVYNCGVVFFALDTSDVHARAAPRSGTLSLKMQLQKAVSAALTVMVVLYYHNDIQVDSGGNVVPQYSSV